MSSSIERGPRKQRDFSIVDNSLLQNSTISFRARGVAAYVLSLPDGAKIDIRTLAAKNPEGRQAIAACFAELEKAGYLVRTVTRGERGRIATRVVMHEDPQGVGERPPSLPKSWTRAKPSTSGDAVKPQVAPDPVLPVSGAPGSGGPVSGNTGSKSFKEPLLKDQELKNQELKPKTSSSPVLSVPHQATAEAVENPEEEDRDEGRWARDFLRSLPDTWRPNPIVEAELVPLIAERLRAGWTPAQLRTELTARPEGLQRPATALKRRVGALTPEPHSKPRRRAPRDPGDGRIAAIQACDVCDTKGLAFNRRNEVVDCWHDGTTYPAPPLPPMDEDTGAGVALMRAERRRVQAARKPLAGAR